MSVIARAQYEILHTYLSEYARMDSWNHPRKLIPAIFEYAQPCIRIRASEIDTTRSEIGLSRYGGFPDLPESEIYPMVNDEPMDFIAQINLADVAPHDASDLLPKTGLLSFFMPKGDSVDLARLIYTEDVETLVRRTLQEDKQVFSSHLMNFQTWISFPETISRIAFKILDVPAGQSWNSNSSLYSKFLIDTPFVHDLLGYPSSVQGNTIENAIVKSQKRNYKSISLEETQDYIRLFQYSIGEKEPTQWNDLDWTFFWIIKREDLRAKRFDKAIFTLEHGD